MTPPLLAFFRLMDPLDKTGIPRSLNEKQMAARERLLRAISENIIKLREVDTCLCGNQGLMQIARKDGFGLDFGAFLCMKCGLILTSPAICDESIPVYYAEYHNDIWHKLPFKDFKGVVGRGHKIFKIVKKALPNKPTLTVLDIGGGTGSVIMEFSESAIEAGWNVHPVLIDYSPDMHKKVKNLSNAHVFIGGLEDLAKTEREYDVVIMSHVVEHFTDVVRQFSNLKRHITTDTLVYIEVPGICSLNHLYQCSCDFLQWFVFCHLYHFNLTSLSYFLSKAGFKPIWGNEFVEAIFQLGTANIDVSRNGDEVLSYLTELERSLPLYQSLNVRSMEARLRGEIKELERKNQALERKDQALEHKINQIEHKLVNTMSTLKSIRGLLPIKALLWAEKRLIQTHKKH